MKYHIITYGCQMNKSDSERLAAKLEKEKCRPAKDIKTADLTVINVCSVRQSAVNRVYSKIKNIRQENHRAKIILTGCILSKDKKRFEQLADEIWPIADISQKAKCPSQKEVLVPIMTGCNNFCSYCAVPYTRGQEKSRPAKEIIGEIKNLVKNGGREITLLGQNVNSYRSGKTDFPKLLEKISRLEGNFETKFMTSHPKDFSDELIKTIAQNEKISREIHLPVQSGNNQILKKMNRGYIVGQYKNLIKKIRKNIPGVKISTDIIVGFPTETKRQFQNTVKLAGEIGFFQIYAAAYSPRPGAAAAKMKDDVPAGEKKRRKKIILDLLSAHKANKKLIVILGPTASGKSSLAVRLAKKFNGEIVSADSRQIYKGMDIGSAKITPKEMAGIPHHLIDIVRPDQDFTLAQYKRRAVKIIKDIQRRGRIPFLVGGTGLYIQAVVDNLKIPSVGPDKKLRQKLEKKTNQELFNQLQKLDPSTAQKIDQNNQRRLVRALEVCLLTKKPFSEQRKKGRPMFDALQIGLKVGLDEIKKGITGRTEKMFEAGLVKEVGKLLERYSANLPAMSGIGYKEIIFYLDKKTTLEKTRELISLHTLQYARRQMTWFKRDKRIHWVKNYSQAVKLLSQHLH